VAGGEERDKVMVQELIAFKGKTEKIVEKSFQNNTQFVYAEKEAFENFINIRQNKPAEFIGWPSL
jgi:cullin-4